MKLGIGLLLDHAQCGMTVHCARMPIAPYHCHFGFQAGASSIRSESFTSTAFNFGLRDFELPARGASRYIDQFCIDGSDPVAVMRIQTLSSVATEFDHGFVAAVRLQRGAARRGSASAVPAFRTLRNSIRLIASATSSTALTYLSFLPAGRAASSCWVPSAERLISMGASPSRSMRTDLMALTSEIN